MEQVSGNDLSVSSCPHCGHSLQRGAQFCGACGASVKAPDTCPACGAAVPVGARFCAECGIRLVGARPRSPDVDAQATLRKEQAALPASRPRSTGSSLGANVLAFVALLAVLVVVIYVMNKGKPKEATMFSGPAPASPPAGEMASVQASAADETVRATEAQPIGGTVRLAEGIEAPTGGTLFIYARRAGQEGGPPLAVQRVQQPQFPLSFQIGASQVMIPGMRWEGPVDISARWDSDGDALSRSPDDLEAAPRPGVELGAMDLTLELR